MTLLLNPWTWLAGLALLAAAWLHGYQANDDADKVQAAWDKSVASATQARQKRIDASRAKEQALQDSENAERTKRHAENQRRDAALSAALRELRDRPARPAGLASHGVPSAAPAGAEARGCTGAELYRDDAEVLARRADLAQRIRDQRDYCYQRYDQVRETLMQMRREAGAAN